MENEWDQVSIWELINKKKDGEKVDINEVDSSGETPLMASIHMNDKELVKQVLALGADINIKNEKYYNFTALHYASLADNLDIVKMLAERGANAMAKTREDEEYDAYTAREMAKSDDVRKYLETLEHGADVEKMKIETEEYDSDVTLQQEDISDKEYNSATSINNTLNSQQYESHSDSDSDYDSAHDSDLDYDKTYDSDLDYYSSYESDYDDGDSDYATDSSSEVSINKTNTQYSRRQKSPASIISHKRSQKIAVSDEMINKDIKELNEVVNKYNQAFEEYNNHVKANFSENELREEKDHLEILEEELSAKKESIYRLARNYGMFNFLRDKILEGKPDAAGNRTVEIIQDEDVRKGLEHNIRWSVRYALKYLLSNLIVRPSKGVFHTAQKGGGYLWKGAKGIGRLLNTIASYTIIPVTRGFLILTILTGEYAYKGIKKTVVGTSRGVAQGGRWTKDKAKTGIGYIGQQSKAGKAYLHNKSKDFGNKLDRLRDRILNWLGRETNSTYEEYRVNANNMFFNKKRLRSNLQYRYLKFDDVDSVSIKKDDKEKIDKARLKELLSKFREGTIENLVKNFGNAVNKINYNYINDKLIDKILDAKVENYNGVLFDDFTLMRKFLKSYNEETGISVEGAKKVFDNVFFDYVIKSQEYVTASRFGKFVDGLERSALQELYDKVKGEDFVNMDPNAVKRCLGVVIAVMENEQDISKKQEAKNELERILLLTHNKQMKKMDDSVLKEWLPKELQDKIKDIREGKIQIKIDEEEVSKDKTQSKDKSSVPPPPQPPVQSVSVGSVPPPPQPPVAVEKQKSKIEDIEKDIAKLAEQQNPVSKDKTQSKDKNKDKDFHPNTGITY